MQRREALAILAGTAVTLPFAGRAQQRPMPVIGYLCPTSSDPDVDVFRQGLKETGYIEGQNLAIEYRYAEGNIDRLPALAGDLVGRKVDVIAAISGLSARAAKSATTTIPIVFMGVGDPVGEGLVASLARPGGNLTGFSNLYLELHPKRLELLSELIPQARMIALLVNPNNPNAERVIRDVQEAAHANGVKVSIVKAGTEGEIDATFASLEGLHAGALLVAGDAFFAGRREQLVGLALRYAAPAIFMWRDFPRAGGLISYGINNAAVWRQAGIYVGRILRGEKPADMPVQQPTKFELVINLKTAKVLGLTVPPSLLARADEVIE